MKTEPTQLPGVIILEPNVYKDERGYFMETYKTTVYEEAGLYCRFVQDNLSFSVKNTLRGLHYQIRKPQAKLVQALVGEIYDVAVDIRKDSPTFGQWTGVHLNDQNKRQLYIPEGFAHGFCVLSDTALFAYKCSQIYDPDDEGGILWSDPDIGIDWPVKDPILSRKDTTFKELCQLKNHLLPLSERTS